MSILYVGALKHGSTSTGILEVALSDNNSPTLFLFKAKPETMRRYYALHFACCLGQVCWSAISPNLQTVQYEFQKMKPAATNAICVLQRPLRCSAGRWGGGSSGGGGRAGWDTPPAPPLPCVSTLQLTGCSPWRTPLHPSLAPNWSLGSTEPIPAGEVLKRPSARAERLSVPKNWKLPGGCCRLYRSSGTGGVYFPNLLLLLLISHHI